MDEATREFEGYSGQIAIEGDTLVLSRRGMVAKAAGLSGDPRRIPLKAISDVALTPATRMKNGSIRLGLGGKQTPGENESRHRNAVLFRYKDKDDFQQLFQILQHAVQDNRDQRIDPSTVEFDEGKASVSERLQAKADQATMQAQQQAAAWVANTLGFKLYADRIERTRGSDAGVRPLAGVSAQVETAEELHRRVTATRIVAFAVFAWAWKKKTGGTSYLTVEGPGFAWVEEVDRKKKKDAAVRFAAQVRAAASALPTEAAENPPPEQPSPTLDPTEQIRRLSELHAAGILTDEEFAAKKADLLDRM